MTLETPSEPTDGVRGRDDGRSATNACRTGRRRQHRRWKRKLALAVILLAAVAWLLPMLASTGPGTRFILARVNGFLPGELGLEAMSLSWSGPSELTGLRLNDVEGREVARIDHVTLTSGVWRLATATFRFEKLSLVTPQVTLYVDQDGRISLLEALGVSLEPDDEEPALLPAVTGALEISRGAIRIVRADGRQLVISRLDGDFSVDQMSTLTGELLVQADEVGTMAAELDLRELTRDGVFDPAQVSGNARFSTPVDLSLAGLGQFLLADSHAEGTANLDLEVNLARGGWTADTRLAMAGLLVRRADSTHIEPIDIGLSGRLHAADAAMTADLALEGEVGDGRLRVTYAWPAQATGLSADEVVSGILTGEPVNWPDMVVEASAHVDLAKLAQALPALLRIHPNVVVTGGDLHVEQLTVRGGDAPSATGAVVLTNVISRRDDQVSEWEPVSLNWDVRIERGTGLRAERVALASGFAELTAGGSPAELHAGFQIDLARLQHQAAQVFVMDELDLAGTLSGELDLGRPSDERIDLNITLVGKDLRYRSDERDLRVGRLSAGQRGYFGVADNRVNRVTVTHATWDADGRVAGAASGWVAIDNGGFDVEMSTRGADLAYIMEHLARFGVTGGDGYAGGATLEARAQRRSQDAPVLSEGSVVLGSLSHRGQPLLEGDVSLRWSGLSFFPGENRFEIRSAGLSGSPGELAATGIDIRADDQPVMEGRFEGNADLAQCLALAGRIAGWEKPPAIEGRLSFDAAARGTADGARLTGDARIDELAIGAGDMTIREDVLRLAVQGNLNNRQETITIDRFRIDSRSLELAMSGKVSDYARTGLLDLSGDYRASWDAITALIHELVPETADTVIVAGASESRFTVTGTLYQPEVHPAPPDLSAAAEVGWASAGVYGVQMGPGRIAPALEAGRLTVPLSTIPAAAGGQVRMGGVLDLREDPPVLSLDRELQILEDVRITPKLGRELLSRVNPIFGTMTRTEGTVSLKTEAIRLPVGEAIKTGGSGRGHLDLRNLKMQPLGPLMMLLELGGLTDGRQYAVHASGLDFHLKDGRLYYERFVLTFEQDLDLRFHGSVGFDDTVDLAVSIPVRPALLERLGVAGPTAEYARRLQSARVEIPIAGTRLQPRLDLTQVDIKPLIAEAARSVVSETAGDLLEGLLGIEREPGTEQEADRPTRRGLPLPVPILPERTTTPEERPTTQPFLDLFRRERR